MKVLGLIPARIGSSEVKKKNLRSLCGKPLVCYSIIEALKSKELHRVVLSTDSEAIQRIGIKYGVEAPFLRPRNLATNETLALPVITHCLEFLSENEGYHPDAVLYMQPTSPFRTTRHIGESINLLKNSRADSVISVVPVKQHPYFMFKHGGDSSLTEFVVMENKPQRRQDLPELWDASCTIMLSKTAYILKAGKREKHFLNYRDFVPYYINDIAAIDIDSEHDFQFAEFMMKQAQEGKG